MAKPLLFAAALLGVCATASPLIKKDNGDDASSGLCFDATIRKEFLLQIKTYEPRNPYGSEETQVRLNIADPTNQDQNAIVCTSASWNSTEQSFPSEYLSCSDPTLSWKLTSYTNFQTFNVIINQTFVQGPFTETILASYDVTENELRGNNCAASNGKGCAAWFMNNEQGHAKVYDVEKNGPPSTPFPDQCPPAPLPTVSNWPIRYGSDGPEDPADASSTIYSQIGFDILTNAQNGWRVKCNGPAWDSKTQSAQPADWYPCPEIEYIPGNWSFRVEAYADYKTFNLGIRQNICNEVQCQDNLAYANLTVATQDPNYSSCNGQGKCTSSSAFKTVDAPIYAVVNVTVVE